jgi:hypothetical protein
MHFEGSNNTITDFQKAKEENFIRFPFYKDNGQAYTFHKYKAGGTPHWTLVNQFGELDYSILGYDPNNALLRLDLKISGLLENNNK